MPTALNGGDERIDGADATVKEGLLPSDPWLIFEN